MEQSSTSEIVSKLACITLNASFAFDNPRFSDYRLQIIVRPAISSTDLQQDGEEREEIKSPVVAKIALCPVTDERFVTLPGICQTDSSDSSGSSDGASAVEPCAPFFFYSPSPQHASAGDDEACVTLHVNSAILAGQSSYFERLFSSDMWETTAKLITVLVEDRQEMDAVVALIRFLHYGTIEDSCPSTTVDGVLKLLIAADRFGVEHAAAACAAYLAELPLDFSTFSSIFQLPEPLWRLPESDLVTTAAKFLERHFKSFDAILLCSELKEEFLSLPLVAVQIMVSANSKVACFYENSVFMLVEEWLFKQGITSTPQLVEEHLELLRAIRYPYLTTLFAIDFVKRSPLLQFLEAQHFIIDALASRCFSYQFTHQPPRQPAPPATVTCPSISPTFALPLTHQVPRPITDMQWLLSMLPNPESRAVARFSMSQHGPHTQQQQPCLAKDFVFQLSSLRSLHLGGFKLHETRFVAFGYVFTVGISRMAAESTMCYGTDLPKEVAQLVWYYDGDERACVDCMLMVRCHCGFGDAPHVCSLQYPSSINGKGIMGRMVMPVESGQTVMGWDAFLTNGHEYEKEGAVHVTLAVKLLHEDWSGPTMTNGTALQPMGVAGFAM